MRNRVVVLARSLGHDGNLRSWVSHDYASSCGKLGSVRLTVSEAQALYDVATRDKHRESDKTFRGERAMGKFDKVLKGVRGKWETMLV